MTAATSSKAHPIEGKPHNNPKVGERVIKDPTFVSDAKRKEYGIKPDEALYWARDSEVWAQYEHSDRQEELMGSVEEGGVGARVVYKPGEFDKVRIGGFAGDLILMAYPKAIQEQIQAETDEACSEYQYGLRQTEEGYESTEDLFDRTDLKRRMQAEHDFHAQTGLVGGNSPTAGMDYFAAQAHVERLGIDVEAKQTALRMGSQHTGIDQQEFAKLITGQRKLFGMGNSGLGKTTQQKLAARGGR